MSGEESESLDSLLTMMDGWMDGGMEHSECVNDSSDEARSSLFVRS